MLNIDVVCITSNIARQLFSKDSTAVPHQQWQPAEWARLLRDVPRTPDTEGIKMFKIKSREIVSAIKNKLATSSTRPKGILARALLDARAHRLTVTMTERETARDIPGIAPWGQVQSPSWSRS